MIPLAVAAYLAAGACVAGLLDLIVIDDEPRAGIDVITVLLWPVAVVVFGVALVRELVRR